jgi:hypothetical protein
MRIPTLSLKDSASQEVMPGTVAEYIAAAVIPQLRIA